MTSIANKETPTFSIVKLAKTVYSAATNLFNSDSASLRSAKAELVHLDGEPFRFQDVQLWDNDLLKHDSLAEGVTDSSGKFNIQYSADSASLLDVPDLFLTVTKPGIFGINLPFYTTPVAADVNEETFDMGKLVIPHWEYMPNFAVPLIYTSPFVHSPEDFAIPLATKMAAASAPLLAIHEIHQSISNNLGPDQLSNQEVQKAFPKNLTQKMEEMNPGSSRADDFLVDSTLNGFAPDMFSVDASNHYHIRYNWDPYEFDGIHKMPNVQAKFNQESNGKLCITEISYQFRKDAVIEPVSSPDDLMPMQSFTPSDGADWETAKQYFRSAQFLYGEISEHLGKGHVNVGQYAIAFNRVIHKNPINKLLSPHLKGVTPINDLGKSIIFGSGSVLNENSPLTDAAIGSALRDALGRSDWKGWRPREPLNDQHRYAKIQQLYWSILEAFVADFFSKHSSLISKHWREIYYLSETLVKNSVDHVVSALPAGENWYDQNEIITKTAGDKALSSITHRKTDPTTADLKTLQQFCCYIIYHATIWHSWRNDAQTDFGGEADYATLSTNPTAVENSFQIFIVNALVGTRYGYLLKNEERDISTVLIQMLKAKRTEFEKLHYDIKEIRSKINI